MPTKRSKCLHENNFVLTQALSSFDIYLKCSLRFLSFHFFPVCKLNFVSNFITIYYGFEMPDSQDNVLDFSVCMTVPLSDCTFIFLPFSTSSETSRLFSYLNVFRFRSHFRFYLLTPQSFILLHILKITTGEFTRSNFRREFDQGEFVRRE